MNRIFKFGMLGLSFAILSLATGCTTNTATINYKALKMYSGVPKEVQYQEIGPISVRMSDFVWASCDDLAREVSYELVSIAKNLGADAIINIKWGGTYTAPTCSRQYGWFAIFGVGGLGPWVVKSDASGIAVKLRGEASKK